MNFIRNEQFKQLFHYSGFIIAIVLIFLHRNICTGTFLTTNTSARGMRGEF